MQRSSFLRLYVMLHPAEGNAAGFARMETQHGRGRITIHVSQMQQGMGTLRALLLAGDAQSGSLLDLGLLPLSDKGCGTLRRENLTFPGQDGLSAYHSLIIATDWPAPRLLLYGALSDPPFCPLWQLKDALAHYLSVPAEDSPAAQAVPPEPEPECPPPEPAPQPELVCPPSPEDAPRPVLTLHCLPPLIWPEAIAELQVYFDTLPPFAPFDAPGWRFVRVPLPGRNPAPYCAVGIRIREHRITEVAYAIPGQPGTLPPGGLRGYRWQAGRNGQGYWTLWQGIRTA